MNRRTLTKVLAVTLLLLFTPLETLAQDASYLFPLPKGEIKVTNDTEGHGYLKNTDPYQIDLQIGKIPEGLDISPEKQSARCYSYGAPILAARAGKVVEQNYTFSDTVNYPSYGSYVAIEHEDKTRAFYGHMIHDTSDDYVAIGDEVKAGQIIGLMGDTGYIISSASPCVKNNNKGTHLHFESTTKAGIRKALVDPEPLGGHSNISAGGKNVLSTTVPYDPEGAYIQHHAGQFPYVLEIQNVYSIHPLQVAAGQTASFQLTGDNFYEGMNFDLPFCDNEQVTINSQKSATVSCTPSGSGLKDGSFINTESDDSLLSYQVEVQSSPSGNPRISEVNYISPKPGELLTLDVRGANLPGTLYLVVKDQAQRQYSATTGCTNEKGNQFLSPGKIITSCRLPLNIGPIERNSTRDFEFALYSSKSAYQDNEAPLYESDFSSNYGISAANITPRAASYYLPQRFTITGKNIHRTNTFFIEGCAKEDMRILEHQSEKIIIECLIQPKPGVDVNTLNGQSVKHTFLFKTQSIYNEQGEQQFTEEEDQEHIVLSGYIEMRYDMEQRVDSISPEQGIIGRSTVFTVEGNNLPYSTESDQIALVWLAHCSGPNGSQSPRILPESYTAYGFDFECVPQFDNSNPSPSFSVEAAANECDFILEKPWNEVQKNAALEKCYESDDRRVKESMWGYFDSFFETLAPRALHVKDLRDNQKTLISEQSVRFISGLYDQIQREERFQFQYSREDGDYVSNGPADISRVIVNSITSKDRHQSISVSGQNLPRTLILDSDDCDQIAITYGSSERYEFVCLLKKVAVEELRFIDTDKQQEIHRTMTEVLEVYEAFLQKSNSPGHVIITLQGVNLEADLELSSEQCANIPLLDKAHTSESSYLCEISGGQFTQPENIRLVVESADGVRLFDGEVSFKKGSSTINTGSNERDSSLSFGSGDQSSPSSQESGKGSEQAFEEVTESIQPNISDDESHYVLEWEFPIKDRSGKVILSKNNQEEAFAYLQIDDLNNVNLDYDNYQLAYEVGGVSKKITFKDLPRFSENLESWMDHPEGAYWGAGKVILKIPRNISRGQLLIKSINDSPKISGVTSMTIQSREGLTGNILFAQADSYGASFRLNPWASVGGDYGTRGKLEYEVINQSLPDELLFDLETAKSLGAEGTVGLESKYANANISAGGRVEWQNYFEYAFKDLAAFTDNETFNNYRELMGDYQNALNSLQSLKECSGEWFAFWENEDKCQQIIEEINRSKSQKQQYETVLQDIRQAIFQEQERIPEMASLYQEISKAFSIEATDLLDIAMEKLREQPFNYDRSTLNNFANQYRYGEGIAGEASVGSELGVDAYLADFEAEAEVKGSYTTSSYSRHEDGINSETSSSQGRAVSSSLTLKIPDSLKKKVNPFKKGEISRFASKILTQLKRVFPKESENFITEGKACQILKRIMSKKGYLDSKDQYSEDCRGLHMVMTASAHFDNGLRPEVSTDEVDVIIKNVLGISAPKEVSTFIAELINSTDIDLIDLVTGSWPTNASTTMKRGYQGSQLKQLIFEVSYGNAQEITVDRITFTRKDGATLPDPEKHFFIRDRLTDYLAYASDEPSIQMTKESFKTHITTEAESDIDVGWGVSYQQSNKIKNEVTVPFEVYQFDRDGRTRLTHRVDQNTQNSFKNALQTMISRNNAESAHLQNILQNITHILLIALREQQLLTQPVNALSKSVIIP